jgi:hypothetical protein
MTVFGYFDKIFSEDCNLSNSKVEGCTIVICVRNIGVIFGHPFYEKVSSGAVKYFPSSHLIFEGVESSLREIFEYEISPKVNKFKPRRIIQDGPFPRVEGPKESFRFMGVLDSPRAWTDWTVVAVSFRLEILD